MYLCPRTISWLRPYLHELSAYTLNQLRAPALHSQSHHMPSPGKKRASSRRISRHIAAVYTPRVCGQALFPLCESDDVILFLPGVVWRGDMNIH